MKAEAGGRTINGAKVVRRFILASIIASLSLTLAACTPGAQLPPLPEQSAGPYLLGAGDVVRVVTFGDQQLTSDFRVNDRGNIAIPLLGSVTAAGLSTEQLEQAIAARMIEKKLFRDPSIAVEVVSYRPIFVLGEVSKPGQYPYQPGMSVLTCVAIAGGFTYRAVDEYVSVVRKSGDGPLVEGRAGRQTLVQPGDVITVFERRY